MHAPLQRIGELLQSECLPNTTKALLYAEVESGMIESALFFQTAPGHVIFRYLSDPLEDAVYDFWESGGDHVPPGSWRGIEYVLVGAKLQVDFTLAETFNAKEGALDRRPRVLARQFPDCLVDYSNPGE